MDQTSTAVALGLQLGISAGMVLVMVIVHSLGLLGIARILDLDPDRLKKHEFDLRAIMLMGSLGLLVFSLHIFEIFLFAFFYRGIGALDTLEQALFYSASAYATLGLTAEYFPGEWRLLGAIEALIGFVLIGWSTAFMVSTMNRLRD